MNANTHLYLYAKGWYKRGDIINDLKRIVAARSGVPTVSIHDVLLVLLELTFKEILESGNPEAKFTDLVGHIGLPTEIAKNCLGILAIVPVTGRDIGKPDPEVLPLAEEAE